MIGTIASEITVGQPVAKCQYPASTSDVNGSARSVNSIVGLCSISIALYVCNVYNIRVHG